MREFNSRRTRKNDRVLDSGQIKVRVKLAAPPAQVDIHPERSLQLDLMSQVAALPVQEGQSLSPRAENAQVTKMDIFVAAGT